MHHPERVFTDEYGRRVYGLTRCEFSVIEIGTDNLGRSALAHEMVHAMQNCIPLGPLDHDDYYHSNWDRDGINDAIEKVRR